jgi:opacity protein-like surface antigen
VVSMLGRRPAVNGGLDQLRAVSHLRLSHVAPTLSREEAKSDMVRKIFLLIALAIVLAASTTMLQAQGIDLFLQGGGSALFDKNYPTTTQGPFGTSYAPGGQFSAGAEARLGSILGLEGAYWWGQNNLRVTQLGTSPGIQTTYGIRHQQVSGDLLLHLPLPIIHPYVAGGLEYVRFSPYGHTQVNLPGFTASGSTSGGPFLSSSNKFGFNYGAGIELKVLPLVGFRVDARDFVTGSPSFGLPGNYNTKANDVEYSLGLVLHLGK